MNPAALLRDATVQDIQLELIRRTRFNGFDGEQVCDLLMRHRPLWTAVVFDRPGTPNYREPKCLLAGGLIKLRDLKHDVWNADTLFILTPTPAAAQELFTVFESDESGAMPTVHDDLEETDAALGTGRQVYGVLTVWWD